jgi:hypothetical protein
LPFSAGVGLGEVEDRVLVARLLGHGAMDIASLTALEITLRRSASRRFRSSGGSVPRLVRRRSVQAISANPLRGCALVLDHAAKEVAV